LQYKENSSTDKTRRLLIEFDILLDLLNIPHQIIATDLLERGNRYRIEWLAYLRNLAMQPFYDSLNGTYTKVIFINDVRFCFEDIYRLLLYQNTDIVCAMDVVFIPNGIPEVYDRWVLRTRNGDDAGLLYPFFTDGQPELRSQVIKGQPVAVFSCWGGLFISTGKPFYEGVRFRWMPKASSKEKCLASECLYISIDFIRRGYKKILIDPWVQVAYNRNAHCGILHHRIKNQPKIWEMDRNYFEEVRNWNWSEPHGYWCWGWAEMNQDFFWQKLE